VKRASTRLPRCRQAAGYGTGGFFALRASHLALRWTTTGVLKWCGYLDDLEAGLVAGRGPRPATSQMAPYSSRHSSVCETITSDATAQAARIATSVSNATVISG
jgi:hypothetical protein